MLLYETSLVSLDFLVLPHVSEEAVATFVFIGLLAHLRIRTDAYIYVTKDHPMYCVCRQSL
jgi:hypothetical protein